MKCVPWTQLIKSPRSRLKIFQAIFIYCQAAQLTVSSLSKPNIPEQRYKAGQFYKPMKIACLIKIHKIDKVDYRFIISYDQAPGAATAAFWGLDISFSVAGTSRSAFAINDHVDVDVEVGGHVDSQFDQDLRQKLDLPDQVDLMIMFSC